MGKEDLDLDQEFLAVTEKKPKKSKKVWSCEMRAEGEKDSSDGGKKPPKKRASSEMQWDLFQRALPNFRHSDEEIPPEFDDGFDENLLGDEKDRE
jgi:hypothetical protein